MNLVAHVRGRELPERLTRRGGARITPVQVALTVVLAAGVATFLLPASIDLKESAVVAGAAVACAVLFRHPKWCLVALLATTTTGLYTKSIPVGPIDLRVSDAPLGLLMAWVIHIRVQQGRRPRNAVGQLPLALMLLALGASLLASYGAAGSEFVDLAVSLARAVATFSLAWLVPYAVSTPTDRLFVLRALALAACAELGLALFRFAEAGFPARLRGANGPNAEGLIAVAVIVLILNPALFKPRFRLALGILAGVCLVLTRSIASIASLMILLGLFGLQPSAARRSRDEALVRPARVLVLILGGFLLISTLRPQDLPSERGFQSSSTATRLSLGYAGVRIFLEHPVLGVGWQRSSSASVIGSADLVSRVNQRFSQLGNDLGPTGQAVTVHNAYIQVLAEGGIVAILVLLAGLVVGRRGARAVVARAGAEVAIARTLVAELFVVLIWWNDNPIFGAQPETVLFAVFLGLLASVPVAAAVSSGRDRGQGEPASIAGG